MAELGKAHIHITWDTEPTDEAKAFIRGEVISALKELIGESSWFKELVQEEVKRVVPELAQERQVSEFPRFAVVAEPGPELISLPKGSTVVPKSDNGERSQLAHWIQIQTGLRGA